MSRVYHASRRRKVKASIPLPIEHDVDVPVLDANGRPTGASAIETRTETFTCRGEVTSLMVSEIAHVADLQITDPSAMAKARAFFYGAFGDDAEYQRFFQFALEHLDDDDLVDIMQGLVEDFAARPTQPSNGSSDRPSPSGDGSTGSSSPLAAVEISST